MRNEQVGGATVTDATEPDDEPIEDPDAVTMEDIVGDLERVVAERDEFFRLAQSKQAELENFRKRMAKQLGEEVARGSGRIVVALLPVLDAFDYAAAHGDEALTPMRDQLLAVLEKEGLSRLESTGVPFDPTLHEAVAHDPADESADGPIVSETMRAGYEWLGQLLRPAMVRVRG